MRDYIAYYHTERNHQGKNDLLLLRRITTASPCDAATGWVDFCGTIIATQRESAVWLWLSRRVAAHG
jgi:hypothetical protein